jgi:outer membrane protein OmpA-like peptidoglycan-associated protein
MTEIYVPTDQIVKGVSVNLAAGDAMLIHVGGNAMPTIHLIEIEDRHFRTNSAVVLPETEDPSSNTTADSRKTSAVGIVTTCLRFASEHPSYRILVAGHTDTKGNFDYNERLSQMRAETVTALLTGDKKRFAEICVDRRYMTNNDYNQILAWVADTFHWKCHPGEINGAGNAYVVNDFRKEYNAKGPGKTWATKITEWGDPSNKETWEAYFNCYEDYMVEALGTDRKGLEKIRSNLNFAFDRNWVGCNEYHPRTAKNIDEFPSETNRRVEIMYFDPEDTLPTLGCVPDASGCTKQACELYNDKEYDRIILPPMITAKEWRAEWENQTDPAGSDLEKKMILYADDLPDRTAVKFTVFAVVDGSPPMELETLTASGINERVECGFKNWYNEVYVKPLGTILSLSNLPKVSFFFEATCTSRRVVSPSIDYSDSVSACFYEDEAKTKPLSNSQFVLWTPWFEHASALDSRGATIHNGLPPGGAHIILADYQVPSTPTPTSAAGSVIGLSFKPKDDVEGESGYHPWMMPVIATIYFQTGSSELDNDDDAAALDQVWTAYDSLFTASNAEVPPLIWPFIYVGYSDIRPFSEGGENGNQTLSDARARAVFNYLAEPERFGNKHPNYKAEVRGMGVDFRNTDAGDAETLKYYRRVDIFAPPPIYVPPPATPGPTPTKPLGSRFTFQIMWAGSFGFGVLNYAYFEFIVTDNTNGRKADFTYSGIEPGISWPVGMSFQSNPVTIDTAPMLLEDWHGFSQHACAGFSPGTGYAMDSFTFHAPRINGRVSTPINIQFESKPGDPGLIVGASAGIGGFYKEKSYYPKP